MQNRMSSFDLRKYVKNIYELETSLFQQSCLISEVEYRKGKLPERPNRVFANTWWSIFPTIGFWIVGAILIGVPFWLNMHIAAKVVLGILSVGIGLLCIVYGISLFKLAIHMYITERKSYNEKQCAYEKNKSLQVKLNHRLERLYKKIGETEALLQDYYDLSIILPFYRNVKAISAINQYLESGRCEKLEGPDGAYSLYEREEKIVRANEIAAHLQHKQADGDEIYDAILHVNEIAELESREAIYRKELVEMKANIKNHPFA